MVFGKEDHDHVDLNLSLGISMTSPADPRSALISLPALQPPPPQPPCWNDVFFGSGRKACHEMPFLRGIDVNRAPVAAVGRENYSEDYEEAGLSSPNSTLSSLSGKRGLPAASGRGGEQETERSGSRGPAGSDDEDGADTGAGGSRKKLRLSKDQSAVLEESFKEHNTLNPRQKLALANQLNLKPRQVEVWFQNRRARTKLKQTEVDYEFLKRCCESLTEENRRLQKEVQELRALELVSPRLYMQMAPPTTLTMCPSCERVSGAASSGLPPKPAHAAAAVGPCGPSGPYPCFWMPRPTGPDRHSD